MQQTNSRNVLNEVKREGQIEISSQCKVKSNEHKK